MVSHLSLSDSKSLQVSRALLTILADLNNAVVWMVFTRPLISKSSCPWINPLVTVPRAPIALGITVTFMSQFFFQFSQWPVGTAKSTIWFNDFFFVDNIFLLCFWSIIVDCLFVDFFMIIFLFIITRCVRLAEISLYFKGQILGCAYAVCSHGQISISWTIPSGSPCPHSRV